MDISLLLAFLGFVCATPLGIAVISGNFQVINAVEDLLYGGQFNHFWMWPLAIGWAMVFIAVSIAFGVVNIEQAEILKVSPNWFGHLFGGLSIGIGISLTNMCAFESLARLGTGSVRALFIILVIAIVTYIATKGPLAIHVETLFPSHENSLGHSSFASMISSSVPISFAGVLCVFGFVSVSVPMMSRTLRSTRAPFWAIFVGVSIAMGWVFNLLVAQRFDYSVLIVSQDYSSVLGEGLGIILGQIGTIGFGIGSVLGVIFGGFLGAFGSGMFELNDENSSPLSIKDLVGAILIGIGGVVAFGGSIGQGLSAMSLLYMGAPITLISIFLGVYISCYILENS